MKHLFTTFVALLSCCLLTAFAGDPEHFATLNAGKYPLEVCPVSGERLGEMGDPVVKTYDGREVKFCCASCIGTFEKDLQSSFKSLDEKIIAAAKDRYPLTTCVVSGEELGGMGEPVIYMYQNQPVKFCCAACISSFEKNPVKYLQKIAEAAQAGDAKTERKE